jgi:hypothetical protein
MDKINAAISNITNEAGLIKKNPNCIATINARIFNSSPINAKFLFYLDSTEGEFEAQGKIQNLNAGQLNAVAIPLANTELTSLHIESLAFQVHGDDFSTKGKVEMKYNNLALILRKTDEKTGATKTKRFLTKILNRFSIYPSNPSEGTERVANDVVYARISSKAFFGVVWKTIFAGMQNIMMKSGRYQ